MTNISNNPLHSIESGKIDQSSSVKKQTKATLDAKGSKEVSRTKKSSKSNEPPSIYSSLKNVWKKNDKAPSKSLNTNIVKQTHDALNPPQKTSSEKNASQALKDIESKIEIAEKHKKELLSQLRKERKEKMNTEGVKIELKKNKIELAQLKLNQAAFAKAKVREEQDKQTFILKSSSFSESTVAAERLMELRNEIHILDSSQPEKQAFLELAKLELQYLTDKKEMTNEQKSIHGAKVDIQKGIISKDSAKVEKAKAFLKQCESLNICQEIVETERAYLKNLEQFSDIVNVISSQNPQLKAKLDKGKKALEAHIKEARKFQNEMNSKLNSDGKMDSQGIISLYQSKKLNEGYAATIKDYLSHLGELQQLSKMDHSKIYPNKTNLEEKMDILGKVPIMPVQRIMRHDLLMETLVKNASKEDLNLLQSIHQEIKNAAKYVNS